MKMAIATPKNDARIEAKTTPMSRYISPYDVAREAGISDRSARRILSNTFTNRDKKSWMRWDESKLPELVQLCQSQQQRHRLNQYNAVPVQRG